MAVQDNPKLVTVEEFDNPNFFPILQANSEPEDTARRRRMEAGLIASSNKGETDFISAAEFIIQQSDKTGDESRRLATSQATQAALNENEQILEQLLIESPLYARDTVNAFTMEQQEIENENDRQDAPYQVITRQFQDPSKIDEEQRQEIAARAALADQVENIMASQSVWGLVGDIALDLIPGKALSDIMQASGTANVLDTEEAIRQLVGEYQAMSPAEKLDRVPLLAQELEEFLPKFRVAQILGAIIDPSTEDQLAFEFGPMAIFEAAAIAAGLLAIAKRAKDGFNAVKIVNQSGDTESAAKINTTILMDETGEISEVTGISKETATNNSLPFGLDVDPASDPSLSAAAQNSITDFRTVLSGKTEQFKSGDNFIAEPVLPDSDIDRAVDTLDNQFEEHIAKLREQEKINSVERVGEAQIGPRGVTFNFKVTNVDGTEEIGEFNRAFKLDDIGRWESIPDRSNLADLFLSPLALAKGTQFQEAVLSALRLDITQAAVTDEISKLLVQAMAPMGRLPKVGRRNKINQLSEVLTYGDDAERVFTPSELRSGVAGHRMDDDQIAAYYNVRAILDATLDLRNHQAYRALSEQGARTIFAGDRAIGFGTPIESADEAAAFLERQGVTAIFDTTTGTSEQVSNLAMAPLYASNKRVVRLVDDFLDQDGGTGIWNLALVDHNDIRNLPQVVLDRKVGYVPRINPQGIWFVQAIGPSMRNGVRVENGSRKAVRSFDSKAEAEQFAKQFEAEIKGGATDFPTTFVARVNRDNEIEQFRVGDSGLGGHHGLIYGPRRSEELPFGHRFDDLEVPRLGAFESIGLYLQNTTNFISRNEWRMGMQRKWEETARFQTQNREITFNEPGTALENTQLARAHQQILEWSGFMSKNEQMYDDMVQRVYEFVLDTSGRNRVTEALHTVRHRDLTAAIKSASFHSLLGAWNPAQSIVQASGSAVAMSQGITNVPQKLFRINALAATDNFDLPPEAFNAFARSFGWKPETLRKYNELWGRSGLRQSTYTSADIEAAKAGYGTTSKGVRSAINSSTMFFRAGELFNRRIAFMQAIDEAGGIDKVLGNNALERQVLTRVNDLVLNLTRGNRAFWQKGALGIPTQFMQIIAKTGETFLNLNGFSNRAGVEFARARMAMAQWMLFGAAGVPFGLTLNRMVLSNAEVNQTDINKEENQAAVRFANGGLSDMMMYTALGADVVISDRVGLLNGFDQTMISFIAKETVPFDLITGPSGGVAKRMYDKWKVLSPFFARYSLPKLAEDYKQGELLTAAKFFAEDAGELLTSPLSSARQVDRYIQMQNLNRILDKRGGVVVAKDFDTRTEIAALIGLKPADLDAKYNIQELNENTEKYKESMTNQLMYGWLRMWQEIGSAQKEGREITTIDQDRYRIAYDFVMASISNDNVRAEVLQRFEQRVRRLADGEDQLSRQQQEFYRTFLNDLADDAAALHIKLTPVR